jgi:hypothetical protein
MARLQTKSKLHNIILSTAVLLPLMGVHTAFFAANATQQQALW